MPSYILTFQKTQPNIHILLDDGGSEEMAASVLAGRSDLAIVGRIPYDPALESIPFPGHEVDELLLVVNPGHPLAERSSVSLKEVSGEDFILRQKGSGTRQAIDDRAQRMGINLRVLLEAGSPEFIKDLVKKNVGVSILTQLSVEEEVRKGNLRTLSFIEGRLYLSLDILRLRDSYPRPAVSAFLTFLEQQKAASAAGSIALTLDS
jgi:DNA-binding transcriptional LysR family regulator